MTQIFKPVFRLVSAALTLSLISFSCAWPAHVFAQSRIKDLRTGVEVGATDKVLDGDLDPFLEASLKAGL